ncbi:unnamed protein product [Prorocentrum cordatum]|uniref:Ion transport domain-containing protein n=1 Tax=Prorocentrum cordatum TaxID=2364126 RepID=A0ABN9PFM9_9DINO|nr:unnamed protein product [Polarella glacialis]
MSLSPFAKAGALYSRVCRWARRWQWFVHDVREPLRTGYIAECVMSRSFEIFFSFVIVLNAIYMALAMNYQVRNPMNGQTLLMGVAEVTFVSLYSVELVSKLIVHRWFFFWNKEMRWNVLDFGLVVYGIFDIVFEASFGDSGSQSPSWLRALRLFKMAKVLRMLRVIRTFHELHLIMACIAGSIQSLFWSLVMMCVIMYMFSLVFVQQAAAYLGSGNASDEMDGDILAHYGSVEASMFTLFKTLFGGDDWSPFYEIMAEVSFLTQVLFVVFVAVSQVGESRS